MTLKESCSLFGNAHAALATVKSLSEINCMGKVVNAGKICERKYSKNKNYLRGFVKNDSVFCQFGESLFFEYVCTDFNSSICKYSAKKNCTQLKSKIAANLKLSESSFENKTLHCKFVTQNDQKILDIPPSLF